MLVVSSSNVWLDYSVIPLPEASIKWTYFFFFNPVILEAGGNRRKSAVKFLKQQAVAEFIWAVVL